MILIDKKRRNMKRSIIKGMIVMLILLMAQTFQVNATGMYNVKKSDQTAKKHGIYKINNKLYCYKNGKRYKRQGFFKLKNKFYYLKKSGDLKTGWLKVNKRKYYFNNKGVLQKNKWIKGLYVGKNGEVQKYSDSLNLQKDSGKITKKNLDKLKLNKTDKLMIVAHPDDETLWGGGHMLEGGYLVVCFTNESNPVRKAEFEAVIKDSGNKGIILDYPDQKKGVKNKWKKDRKGIISDINLLLSYKDWSLVVTHNPEGEYGHIHHKMLNQMTTVEYHTIYQDDNLYYFGRIYDEVELEERAALMQQLPKNVYKKKQQMLKRFYSQRKTVKNFARMSPYEEWIAEKDWYKEIEIVER